MTEQGKTTVSRNMFFSAMAIFIISVIFNAGVTYSRLAQTEDKLIIIEQKTSNINVLEDNIRALKEEMAGVRSAIDNFNRNILEFYKTYEIKQKNK